MVLAVHHVEIYLEALKDGDMLILLSLSLHLYLQLTLGQHRFWYVDPLYLVFFNKYILSTTRSQLVRSPDAEPRI